jgi:hypothetical protein
MNKKSGPLLSRRQFAHRAAVLSATATLVPAEVILPDSTSASAPRTAQSGPKLTAEGQLEADSRYQQILNLYSDRLDGAQKANLKRMCADLQPALEKIRSFTLENGTAPALYLKPLVERDKKQDPSAASKKP